MPLHRNHEVEDASEIAAKPRLFVYRLEAQCLLDQQGWKTSHSATPQTHASAVGHFPPRTKPDIASLTPKKSIKVLPTYNVDSHKRGANRNLS